MTLREVHMAAAIAFFDLDKTLIRRNSATLWVRFERAGGRMSGRQALQAMSWLLRYSVGGVDMAEPIRRGAAALAGQREADMRERVGRFYAELVRPLFRPGARAAVQAHRQAGDRVVLLTSSSNYVSELVCRDLGLDDYVCNRLEVDPTGCYTGRTLEPLCFGPGKVVLAERYVRQHGTALANAAFYTDSHSDVPMLEAVGRPVAVHPDPRLRRLARKRGWPTVNWDTPHC